MNLNSPSRKRVLPSWMKSIKTAKGPHRAAVGSSKSTGVLGYNNSKETTDTHLGESSKHEKQTTDNSIFIPRNTVLFVMSERELLETAQLVLQEGEEEEGEEGEQIEEGKGEEEIEAEENENSSSHLMQPDGIESTRDNDIELREQKPSKSPPGNPVDMINILDGSQGRLKSPTTGVSDCPRGPQLKPVLKRRLEESRPHEENSDEDAMDIEIPSQPIEEWSAGPLSFGLLQNKNGQCNVPSCSKTDSISGNLTLQPVFKPTPKKRLKPDLSILDEIFF